MSEMTDLERQLKDAELLTSFPGGFGRPSCKIEGEMEFRDVDIELNRQVEPTTWVEREVPEYLEDAAHDLITALLKSHGYNSDGEKQDDNRPAVK